MLANKKLQVWLPLIFSLVMIVGMYFGYKLGNPGGGGKDFFASNKRSSLEEALDLIRLKYVDAVQTDSLEGRAIQEMMSELDPHSVYFPPVELEEANEDLAGNFEGIGVEFNLYSDTVNVVYVIPQGPSDRAGLKIGDKIIKVDDSLLAGKNLNTDDIRKRIRGKRNSSADLQILREGKMSTVRVNRGTIPVPSVDATYMLDAVTGYIKLNKFTDQSYEEFMASMETLIKAGMTKLVFDLRGNGGGFMNEAVDMADEFLDGDKLIVYTEGVNSRKREYKCKRPGLFEKGEVVVLVDELSASASEVLAAALQDWCRARIVGRRTFGKGLVQEQYGLSDGSAIRLTVARYYSPTGRSIQRSYDKGKKIYMDELWERFSNGEMTSLDSVRAHRGKAFTTVCSDTVYAADGITPHVFVPIDTSRHLQKINRFLGDGNFSNFVYNYYLTHKAEIDQYKNSTDYASRFNSESMWNEFLVYAKQSPAVSFDAREKELLKQRLKALLARYRWRNSGFFEILNADDPAVRKAREILNS